MRFLIDVCMCNQKINNDVRNKLSLEKSETYSMARAEPGVTDFGRPRLFLDNGT